MKTTVPFLQAMLCTFLLLNFTAKANNFSQPGIDIPKGEYSGCFVQYTDGSIKQYNTLKLITGFLKTPHLVANDSITIYASQVNAYQTTDGFAIAQKELSEGRKTYVAKNVLPGFALRVVKGHINVFSIKYYNGQNITEKLFVQQGESITLCTPELMETLVKDNNDAVTILTSKNNSLSAIKKILTAAEIYNNSRLLSKN